MKRYFTIFLFFLSMVSFGQNQQKIDSLKILIAQIKVDSVKALEYLELGNIIKEEDSSLYYYEKTLELSRKSDFPKGISKAMVNIANWKSRNLSLEEAIVQHHIAIKELNKYKYLPGLGNHYIRLGYRYNAKPNYDSLNKYINKGIAIANQAGSKSVAVTGLNALANIAFFKNDFEKALKYDLDAEKICLSDNLLKESLKYASIIKSIGLIFDKIGENQKAYNYYIKSKNIFEDLGNQKGIQSINLRLGGLLSKTDSLEKAVSYLSSSINYYEGFKGKRRHVSLLGALSYRAGIYLKQSKIDAAKIDYTRYSKIAHQNGSKYYIRRAFLYLGKFYFEANDNEQSQTNFIKSYTLGEEENDVLIQREALKGLISVYKVKKDFQKLAAAFEKYVIVMDTIDRVNMKKEITNIEAKYQTEKKEQEIILLKSQNELSEQQKKNQRNVLLGGVGISSLAGLFFFFLYRNRQRTTKKLQELDSAKSNFFANISHEFRTPLTLISGPIQKQLKKENLLEEERNNLEMMQRNSNRLLSLVDQLLDISKIETGSLRLAISKKEILPFIGTLADGFTFIAKQKQLDYTVNIDAGTIKTWYDKEILEKIVINLLSNAVKYTPEKGSIVCNAFIKNKQLYFEVKNTGNGLSKDEITKVFERFYQINNDKQGVGIGLALVKELVSLHKGSISVESISGEWTLFKVELPIAKEYFNASELISENFEGAHKEVQNSESVPETNIDKEKSKDADGHLDGEAPILLIVDDNEDVRTYVSNLFKDEYVIYLAKNGQEGIDLALEHIPDIIISDIMMPVKNGIELCNTLKTDECTSHIPIMLLTAKAGEKNEIEGAKTGADDYTTKPFSEDLLKLKVEKLIESRKKLQLRYSQEIILRPKDIAVNSVDEQFLERVQSVLDDKLVESSFSIDEFSQSVGMSRMQLHRKLKALTGLSASEFIRSQRLKLAAQLLRKSDINVSQIGYSVGFNDHAYFSKCFKEMYNCTPTEYVKNIN